MDRSYLANSKDIFCANYTIQKGRKKEENEKIERENKKKRLQVVE
jgi:hypothetical protein